MKISEVVFLLLICGLAGALCLHGWLVEGQGPLVLAAPAALAVVLLLLAALRLVRMQGLAVEAEADELQRGYWQELRGSVRPMLWSLSAAPLLLAFGYPLGLAVFAGLYARTFGSSWSGACALAVFTFALVWGGAGLLFGVPVPVLPGWLA